MDLRGKSLPWLSAAIYFLLEQSSEAKSPPFELVASLCGHTKAAVCLAVVVDMLYSVFMDHSIKVWDLDTLQCKMTLNGHNDVVTSLICWDHFLLSSSSDCTIEVWVVTEEGTLKVTYTQSEENGVVALCGMPDAKAKPILFCSCIICREGSIICKTDACAINGDRSRWTFLHWRRDWFADGVEMVGRAQGGVLLREVLCLSISCPVDVNDKMPIPFFSSIYLVLTRECNCLPL